ncbi:hypothetical protein POVCU2_0041110 [Plasmodium ovale curtisi]|uniref:Uncharacterized protein n=1 Tax=Plasmodium ovale curtisi TaxID=864141 RepID=A0A1A8W2K0_PLAOA|nr:hypothetical protein POVCU2_0041110 [Plasmodium ovale curtisi]
MIIHHKMPRKAAKKEVILKKLYIRLTVTINKHKHGEYLNSYFCQFYCNKIFFFLLDMLLSMDKITMWEIGTWTNQPALYSNANIDMFNLLQSFQQAAGTQVERKPTLGIPRKAAKKEVILKKLYIRLTVTINKHKHGEYLNSYFCQFYCNKIFFFLLDMLLSMDKITMWEIGTWTNQPALYSNANIDMFNLLQSFQQAAGTFEYPSTFAYPGTFAYPSSFAYPGAFAYPSIFVFAKTFVVIFSIYHPGFIKRITFGGKQIKGDAHFTISEELHIRHYEETEKKKVKHIKKGKKEKRLYERKWEVSVIHKNVKKKVDPKSWPYLVEQSIHLIKDVHNLKDATLNENDLIIWSKGKRLDEKFFNSSSFQVGITDVYVFVSADVEMQKCFTKDNIFKKISEEVDRYKNLFMSYFNLSSNESEDWKQMKGLLKLLFKSKEFRELCVDAKTDEQIESIRKKIHQLTHENKNYVIFLDVIKSNKIVDSILEDSEKWKTFIHANLEKFKKMLEQYYPSEARVDL